MALYNLVRREGSGVSHFHVNSEICYAGLGFQWKFSAQISSEREKKNMIESSCALAICGWD